MAVPIRGRQRYSIASGYRHLLIFLLVIEMPTDEQPCWRGGIERRSFEGDILETQAGEARETGAVASEAEYRDMRVSEVDPGPR